MKVEKNLKDGIPDGIKKLIGFTWMQFFNGNKTVRLYSKGEEIYQEGVPVTEMGFVIRGKMKIVASYGQSNEHLLRLVKDEGIIGIRAYGNEMVFPATAIALTECEITFIPLQLFDELLRMNNTFCYHFMMLIAHELRQSEKQSQDFSRMEMRERLAYAILMNLDAFGYSKEGKGLLDYTLSRTDFSSIIGTSYETVIRMLAELEKLKLIRLENKNIRILNEEKLRKLAQVKTVKPKEKVK